MSWAGVRNTVEHRRHKVAELRLRGFTIREIEQLLFDSGIYNEKQSDPENGIKKAWSRGAIGNDLKILEEEWKESSRADIAQHKANVYAEILEVRRAAWKEGRLDLVLRGLEDERKLFGLDAPAKQELSGPGGGPIETTNGSLAKLTDEELATLIAISERIEGGTDAPKSD